MKPCRIEAALTFHGDRLLPEVVSAELGLAPTDSWRKGDPARGGPRYPPQRTGLWSLDSDETLNSVEAHAEHLLGKIRHLDVAALDRMHVDSAHLFVMISLEPSSDPSPSCSWDLSAEVVEELARLGIRFRCVAL